MTSPFLGRLRKLGRRQFEPEQLPFPTASQLDLLRAALLPAEQAAPARQRWKARGLELQSADRDSIRIFSHLWSNRDRRA